MDENRFLEVMRKHSDAELLEILNVKRTEYVADAISAVEQVLKERGVGYEKKPDEDFNLGEKILTIEKIKVSLESILDAFISAHKNVIEKFMELKKDNEHKKQIKGFLNN